MGRLKQAPAPAQDAQRGTGSGSAFLDTVVALTALRTSSHHNKCERVLRRPKEECCTTLVSHPIW